MRPTTIPPSGAAVRLRKLLDRIDDGARAELVAEARTQGAEETCALLSLILDREVATPTGSGAPVRAAQLAGALGLPGAAPSLARCVDLVPCCTPLHDAAAAALLRLGPAGVAALLARFDACDSPDRRAHVADVLARTGASHEELRPAFLRMLDDDPVNGARHLADRGDWAALPDLTRAMYRLTAEPVGDCIMCEAEHLGAVASAIRALGGAITDGQQDHLDDLRRRSEALWIPLESALNPAAAFATSRGRGRGRRRLH